MCMFGQGQRDPDIHIHKIWGFALSPSQERFGGLSFGTEMNLKLSHKALREALRRGTSTAIILETLFTKRVLLRLQWMKSKSVTLGYPSVMVGHQIRPAECFYVAFSSLIRSRVFQCLPCTLDPSQRSGCEDTPCYGYRERKKTPKEIQHKDLFFAPPTPPFKILCVCDSSYISKRKTA